MKQKKLKFIESEDEKEMKQAADDKATADHGDEEQDKELFAKMIKQYLGKEEPDEMECEMAKQAYQTHKEKGMDHEAAMEAAGKHLQMAAEIGKKMHQAMQAGKESEVEDESEKHEMDDKDKDKDSEKCEDESEKHEDESEVEESEKEKKEAQKLPPEVKPGKKESAQIAKLSGEIAKLRESLKSYEMKDYLDSKLKKSGESNACTKLFREALGKARNKQHIDETWNTFIKAYKAGAEEVGSDDVFFLEKQTQRTGSEEKKVSFTDCLD